MAGMALTDEAIQQNLIGEPVREASRGASPPERRESRASPGRARLTKATLVAVDAVSLGVAIVGAIYLTGLHESWGAGDSSHHLSTALVSLPIWLVAFARFKLYQARYLSTRRAEWRRLLNATGFGTIGVVLVNTVLGRPSLSRTWLVLLVVIGFLMLAMAREVVRRSFGRMRSVGKFRRRVVVVGDNTEASEIRAMMDADPSFGCEFAGYLSVYKEPSKNVLPDDVLGSIDDAEAILSAHEIDQVIVAGSAIKMDTTKRLARRLLDRGIHLELSPSLPDIASERLTIRSFGRFPLVYLEPYAQDGWRAHAKRVFDATTASVGLILASPLLLATAVAVRLDSRGPIFYRQTRVGQNDEPFDMIKFRSMVPNAHDRRDELTELNESDGPLFKVKDDPRITRVGRTIRKFSIDELPQLWNVVIGDMALVGPRPALPEEAAEWSDELRNRLRVKPGITGMWQVSGRSSTGFDEYSRLDLYYVDNWSLFADLSILARTVPVVLLAKGAS